ncbi:hypothetical protein ACOQFO_11725 [Ureibacillus sp. MALMAid1270]|uniref:hypothetical protein n=1 Tax=Ureibacillus sp. MALMAid1270 TaxID=3411629 RepID=UPI003BA561BA
MKKLVLILIGFIPFVIGLQMNTWLMENQDRVLPFEIIGIVFLIFWILVGFITSKFEKTPLKTAIIINLPAFLVLLLIMYQSIILGHTWPNLFGLATQMYFLPLVNISSKIIGILFFYVHIWSASLLAFLLMFVASYFGSYLRRRLVKS